MTVHTAATVLQAIRHDVIRDETSPSGLFLSELQAPSSNQRIDALWVQKHTGLVTGYEIKVTKADLEHELRNPEKCDPWKRYCDAWWLAVGDPKILNGLEHDIPEDWGILTPPTMKSRRKLTVIRPASKLTPVDQKPLLGKLSGTVSWRLAQTETELSRIQERMSQLLEEKRALTMEVARSDGTVTSQHQAVADAIRHADQLLVQYGMAQGSVAWGRYAETTDPQKLGEFIAHAYLAQSVGESVLEQARSRVTQVENALSRALEPMSSTWNTKRLLSAIEQAIDPAVATPKSPQAEEAP